MPALQALERVDPRTIRFWAWMDSSVSWVLALPPMAHIFVRNLYRANGWLGGTSEPPPFLPIHWFFVCLSGVLVSQWVLIRLLRPMGVFALVDVLSRLAVCALLLYFVLACAAPAVLYFFVATEMAGVFGQGLALLRAWTPASSPPQGSR